MALRLKNSYGEIEVVFHHKVLSANETWEASGADVDGPRRCSTALVMIDGVEQGRGTIVCHPNDNFSKALGRQKSLTLALDCLSRAIRKDVWDKYGLQIGFA